MGGDIGGLDGGMSLDGGLLDGVGAGDDDEFSLLDNISRGPTPAGQRPPQPPASGGEGVDRLDSLLEEGGGDGGGTAGGDGDGKPDDVPLSVWQQHHAPGVGKPPTPLKGAPRGKRIFSTLYCKVIS